MTVTKRICLFFFAIALSVTLLSVTLYRGSRAQSVDLPLRIGAGDDITGVFMEELLAAELKVTPGIELTTFMDCCGSAAQWAIAGDELDAGLFCSSIALTLVNKNDDLEIYSPAVLNAELVAYRENAAGIRKVAVPMKRSFIGDIVVENFPLISDTVQTPSATLFYALSGGDVDGAVVDTAKALRAPDFSYMPLSEVDHVSYCLVVNKKILDTPEFAAFLKAYNEMADIFNDPGYLRSRYDMDDSFWQAVNMRFLKI